MLRGLLFVMGVDLQVRFQKGQYVFVRFCNGVSVCLCIKSPSRRCINNPLYVYVDVCVYECMYMYICMYMLSMCVCLYVHLCMCMCMCICVCASKYMCMYLRVDGFLVQVQYRLKLLIFRIFNMSSVYQQVSGCVINKELQSSKSIVLECNTQIKECCPLCKHLLCERI